MKRITAIPRQESKNFNEKCRSATSVDRLNIVVCTAQSRSVQYNTTGALIEHFWWRIKWYVSLAMFGTVCAARLVGVMP